MCNIRGSGYLYESTISPNTGEAPQASRNRGRRQSSRQTLLLEINTNVLRFILAKFVLTIIPKIKICCLQQIFVLHISTNITLFLGIVYLFSLKLSYSPTLKCYPLPSCPNSAGNYIHCSWRSEKVQIKSGNFSTALQSRVIRHSNADKSSKCCLQKAFFFQFGENTQKVMNSRIRIMNFSCDLSLEAIRAMSRSESFLKHRREEFLSSVFQCNSISMGHQSCQGLFSQRLKFSTSVRYYLLSVSTNASRHP